MKEALILCNKDFGSDDAKTANDLVRLSQEFTIRGVIDKAFAGKDTGKILDGKKNRIPIFASIKDACKGLKRSPKYLIIGTLSVSGELPQVLVKPIQYALKREMTIINGLHILLAKDRRFASLARKYYASVVDIRNYTARNLRFSGKIRKRHAFVISSVGADANIGKMTSCLKIADALKKHGLKVEFIATGQIGNMVGARNFKPIDSIPGPYESGELEALILEVDKLKPDVIIIEGQGCISYPIYGTLNFKHESQLFHESNVLEAALLEGAKPDALIFTHAPARKVLSGFPRYKMPNLFKEMHLNEVVAGAPIMAITINHEGMTKYETKEYCRKLSQQTHLPVEDVLFSTQIIAGHITSIIRGRKKYVTGSVKN